MHVDILDGLLARVGGVFLQRVENHGIINLLVVLLVEQDGLDVGIGNQVDVIFLKYGFAINEHFCTLNVDHLTGPVIYKVLVPRLRDSSRQFLTHILLQIGFGRLDLLGNVENAEDVLIRLIANGAKQRRDRQFLFSVDIRIQHVVDVCGELHPRTLERDNSSGIERRTVGVVRKAEEHTRGAVKLRNHHTLCSVDDEGAAGGHVGNHTQVDLLHTGLLKAFVL